MILNERLYDSTTLFLHSSLLFEAFLGEGSHPTNPHEATTDLGGVCGIIDGHSAKLAADVAAACGENTLEVWQTDWDIYGKKHGKSMEIWEPKLDRVMGNWIQSQESFRNKCGKSMEIREQTWEQL